MDVNDVTLHANARALMKNSVSNLKHLSFLPCEHMEDSAQYRILSPTELKQSFRFDEYDELCRYLLLREIPCPLS